MKWLMFPIFHLNPYRNMALLQALEAFDYIETRSIYRFCWETQMIKQELEDYQDVNIKSIEEMTELKEMTTTHSLYQSISTFARNEFCSRGSFSLTTIDLCPSIVWS